MGRTRAKLIWEIKPVGTVFDMTGIGKSSAWRDIGTKGITLVEGIFNLSYSTAYHWRARLQYFPLMNYSPWFSTGNNGWNETDFETGSTSAPTSKIKTTGKIKQIGKIKFTE
jgi:hypothetical protein